MYCAVDPTEALSASKEAFRLISEVLPKNTPKNVWRQMIIAVQLVCESLEHKPLPPDVYARCQEEAALLLQRLKAVE